MKANSLAPVGILLVSSLLGSIVQASDQASEAAWVAFRKLYPFHAQGVAVTDSEQAGERYLIVAEPPPHAKIEELQRIAPQALRDAKVLTHRIGHDGWVKDVVFRLDASSNQSTELIVRDLNKYLFGTSYKASSLSLSPRSAATKVNLDISVTAEELRAWLFDPNELFQPLDGGATVNGADLLQGDTSRVYYSAQPGLVVWVIPRDTSIDQLSVPIREFAMDADLILGAVGSVQAVAVIGRERVAPLEVLPPLRAESVILLAATSQRELVQSYERTHILAGRMDGRLDWAPILLSGELIDTEFGSLLNLADQQLKSWSLSGLVAYDRFDYPRPPSWPFKKPLIKELGVSQVLFNWNTRGTGYSVTTENGIDIYALFRTGSLQVSYAGDDVWVPEYERPAYDYFAHLSDPLLVRVVQYCSLYQIFKHFELSTDLAESEASETIDITQAEVSRLIDSVSSADDEARNRAVQECKNHRQQAKSWIGRWFGDAVEDETFCDYVMQLLMDEVQALLDSREDGREKLVETLTSSGTLPPEEWEEEALEAWASIHSNSVFLKYFGDVESIKARYVESAARRPSGWIRTASVVVSRPSGSIRSGVGGHNMDSAVSRFATSDALPLGEVRLINGVRGPRLEVNPKDLPRAHALLDELSKIEREAPRTRHGRRLSPEQLEAGQGRLAAALKTSTFSKRPSRSAALEYTVPLDGGRGLSRSIRRTTLLERAPTEMERALLAKVSDAPNTTVIISREADSYAILTPSNNQTKLASHLSEALDAAVDNMVSKPAGKQLDFHFVGFEESDALACMSAIRARSQRPLDGLIHRQSMGKAFENYRTVSSRFDFRKAQFREPVFRSELSGRTSCTLTVEAPGLMMRIRILFSHLLPRKTIERVRQLLAQATKNRGLGEWNMREAAHEFRKEFKKLLKEVNDELPVDIEVSIEEPSITIVENGAHAPPRMACS